MSCFKLPNQVILELEGILMSFLVGEERAITWHSFGSLEKKLHYTENKVVLDLEIFPNFCEFAEVTDLKFVDFRNRSLRRKFVTSPSRNFRAHATSVAGSDSPASL